MEPLYLSVPEALAKHPDQTFYELLVLIDAIRSGRARERKIAIELLREFYASKKRKGDIKFMDVRVGGEEARGIER
ncbi:hypothetical protein PGH45_07720 [Legionella pneumophila]|nr:hypothetical protein [Legionella pneumophila]